MADKIDKSLTQGPRGSVQVPGEEEISEAVETSVEAQQEAPGPVEIEEQEDSCWRTAAGFYRLEIGTDNG